MSKVQLLHILAVITSAISSAVIGFLSGTDPLMTGAIGTTMNTAVAALSR